jgi:hypothetical protein
MDAQFMVKFQEEGFQLGPYSLEELRSRLASGALAIDWLVQRKGEFAWTPLGDLLGGPRMAGTPNAAQPQSLTLATSNKAENHPQPALGTHSSKLRPAEKSFRILGTALVTITLGAYFAYQTVTQNGLPYQSHPVAVIITDFFCGFLLGLIYYFSSGYFAKRKKRATIQTHTLPGSSESGGSDFITDAIYDQIGAELQNDSVNRGLWTRAYADANGDDAKTRALYIKYRAAQLAMLKRQF